MGSVNDASSFGKPFTWIMTKQTFCFKGLPGSTFFLTLLDYFGSEICVGRWRCFNLQKCGTTWGLFSYATDIQYTYTHVCSAKSCIEDPPSSLKEILFLSVGQLDVQLSQAKQLSIKREGGSCTFRFLCFCFRFLVFKLIFFWGPILTPKIMNKLIKNSGLTFHLATWQQDWI